MTAWHPPSTTQALFLPSLTLKNPIKYEDLTVKEQQINCTVSETFLNTWHKGPGSNPSKQILAKHILTLGNTFATLAQQGAGKIQYFSKQHPQDLVTHIDQGLEMLWRIWLQRFFPEDHIIGEEGAKTKLKNNTGYWYIDPIDGTSNYIKGKKEYSLQLAYIKNHQVQLAYLGTPSLHPSYFIHDLETSATHTPINNTKKLPKIIGTEYLDHKTDEAERYQKILSTLNCKASRLKAIGLGILQLYLGKTQAFYKRKAKLWDIIPPCAYLHLAQPKEWTITLLIQKNPSKALSKDNFQKISPFSTRNDFISHINNCGHDYRVGHLMITPSQHPELENKLCEFIL
eukprot:COSAG01_NODE_216_length_21695_cov_83.368772_7_plen_343_part_00